MLELVDVLEPPADHLGGNASHGRMLDTRADLAGGQNLHVVLGRTQTLHRAEEPDLRPGGAAPNTQSVSPNSALPRPRLSANPGKAQDLPAKMHHGINRLLPKQGRS